jgi:hypothetical protein
MGPPVLGVIEVAATANTELLAWAAAAIVIAPLAGGFAGAV